MVAMKVVLTYQDYVALPNDGKRYEILDGEISVTAAPTFRHQQVLAALLGLLRAHVIARGLGEVVPAPIAVVLADTTVVEPDIVYIAADRLGIVSGRGTVDGAPSLAIEILSPSTASLDRGTKLQLYARYGVPCSWIVDADTRAIEVYRLTAGAYAPPQRFAGNMLADLPPFPSLRLDPATLWP